MKRTPCPLLYAVVVLLTVTSASAPEAAVDDGAGPLGVTAVAAPTAWTARVGALFTAGRHFCTASVVDSPHRDLVITAAHCLDGSAGDLEFVPGYRDGHAPYGVWEVRRRFLPGGWAKGEDEDSDAHRVPGLQWWNQWQSVGRRGWGGRRSAGRA